MKKIALLALLGGATLSGAQTTTYDALTNVGLTYLNSAANQRMGDNIAFGSLGTATSLVISQLDLAVVATAAGTYNETVTVNVFRSVNNPNALGGGTNAAFGSLLGSRTYGLSLTPTGLAAYIVSLPGFNLTAPTTPGNPDTGFGFEFVFGTNSSTASGVLTLGLTNSAPSVGQSSTGIYADTNVNGTLQNNEFSTYAANAAFRVSAQPVPEPASLAALGVGALALLRRRKRA